MLLFCIWLLLIWEGETDFPEEFEDDPEEDFMNWLDFLGDGF